MSEDRAYNKKPLNYHKLIEKLQERGLIVDDEVAAIARLQNISYFRLIGYGFPFEEGGASSGSSKFKSNVSFDQIVTAYVIDRKLRILLLSAIERVEVAIRSIINHELACKYDDSHWYLKAELFKESTSFKHADFIGKIKGDTAKTADPDSERGKVREEFIKHYYREYDSPEYPPCWMVAETLTLGTWSKVYENLKVSADRKLVSRKLDLSPPILQSWLHAISYIRNICAHHSRLFGRRLVIRPHNGKNVPLSDSNYVYNHICVIFWLLKKISPQSTWLERLNQELEKLDEDYLMYFGFTPDWLDNEFWWSHDE